LQDVLPDDISTSFHFAAFVSLEFEDKFDVVVFVSRRNVQMEVKNGLPGNLAVV
jgi:hypothetical protein